MWLCHRGWLELELELFPKPFTDPGIGVGCLAAAWSLAVSEEAGFIHVGGESIPV